MSDCRPKFISAKMKARILAGEIPGWMRNHIRADYIIRSFLSTPPWIKRSDFNELARIKERETDATGIPHVLDHIKPITHKRYCGLTVPWNMQVVTKGYNARKSNHDDEDQLRLDLPRSVEQLHLGI